MPRNKLIQTENNQTRDNVFENIADHLPGMVIRCMNNKQWDMLFISRGAYELTGYTAEELMSENGQKFSLLIFEEDQARIWQEVQTAVKQEKPFEIIYRFNSKNGKQKWVMARGQAICTDKYYENPKAATSELILEAILLDITQQKQTELELRQNKKLQRSILDYSIEGILIHRDLKPLFINQSFLKMLGYDSYQELLKLDSITSLISPPFRESMKTFAEARMKGEDAPEEYEFEALHKDGTKRYLEIKSNVIDWHGTPAILSTIFNITQRKIAMEQAKQQREQLAHTNRINMMGEMTAGIAHELNQPLTAIVNRCSAAKNRIERDNPDLEKIKEALISIEEQAMRSGKIIKQLRSMVKSNNSQLEKININELLNTCLKFFQMEGLFHSVDIITNIAPNLPEVKGDPIQIQQVVLNLIHNANDAMQHIPKDERCLTLTALQHDDSAVQISVSDCGEGIEKEQETKLFDSFFTTKSTGMGMGLSICRTIIDSHNGQLWFSQNPEQGITFRFTLPIHTAKEESKNQTDNIESRE
ncbi:hypothetical protein GCM10009133_12280 [Cocleimonas flava]|uniref:histidine kinase n=1 Tax=Cocleimonas flava TaxID=634765 RepID=A0A4R1F172_9GAMM|nr:PAS domain-containing sensor histidine kinase [Cocleimonas flava]TCJ87593.1 two-component system sensor kinase FixL [Cocleimonas flava]